MDINNSFFSKDSLRVFIWTVVFFGCVVCLGEYVIIDININHLLVHRDISTTLCLLFFKLILLSLYVRNVVRGQ